MAGDEATATLTCAVVAALLKPTTASLAGREVEPHP